MMVCSLICNSCSYKGDPFVEGYSVHSDTHSIVCLNSVTGEIRIAKLRNPEIPNGVNTDVDIESLAIREGEVAVRTHPGKEEDLDVKCPSCGHEGIRKIIIGIQ